jgi:ABC-2 type transport system ATP-binding protein
MRQRLGIASALLKRPKLLLLDEPTNGLDPAGMREVRNLMVHLAQTGVTVLLSSHLLSEVQQVCTSMTIVAHGKAVRSGSVSDVLTAGFGTGGTRVRVNLVDPPAAVAVLTAAGMTAVAQDGHCLVTGAASGLVNRVLGEHGIWADEVFQDLAGLEDVFIALTQDEPAGGRAPGILAPVEAPTRILVGPPPEQQR